MVQYVLARVKCQATSLEAQIPWLAFQSAYGCQSHTSHTPSHIAVDGSWKRSAALVHASGVADCNKLLLCRNPPSRQIRL